MMKMVTEWVVVGHRDQKVSFQCEFEERVAILSASLEQTQLDDVSSSRRGRHCKSHKVELGARIVLRYLPTKFVAVELSIRIFQHGNTVEVGYFTEFGDEICGLSLRGEGCQWVKSDDRVLFIISANKTCVRLSLATNTQISVCEEADSNYCLRRIVDVDSQHAFSCLCRCAAKQCRERGCVTELDI